VCTLIGSAFSYPIRFLCLLLTMTLSAPWNQRHVHWIKDPKIHAAPGKSWSGQFRKLMFHEQCSPGLILFFRVQECRLEYCSKVYFLCPVTEKSWSMNSLLKLLRVFYVRVDSSKVMTTRLRDTFVGLSTSRLSVFTPSPLYKALPDWLNDGHQQDAAEFTK